MHQNCDSRFCDFVPTQHRELYAQYLAEKCAAVEELSGMRHFTVTIKDLVNLTFYRYERYDGSYWMF